MNDHDLVEQILNGNSNAFRFLVSRHQKLVFHMVWRMIGEQTEIEDISQDVFMKVYKNLGKFRGDSKLSTWIASIAWKTCTDFLRKKSRSKVDFQDQPELMETGFRNDTSEKVRTTEMKKLVQQTVSRLPVRYRTVLTLHYLEEFSYPEIEGITGMPAGTVKSYLNRARGLLKKELEKHCGEEARHLLYEDK